ncbi:unnamed protein product, partial [marine sediment metagenome]
MKINESFVERILIKFIKDEICQAGFKKGILGLSGGLDSSVCALLTANALKPENVLGLIMPYKDTYPRDVQDARGVAETLGISSKIIDISPMCDTYFTKYPT